jgi:hypothetical protein
MRELVMAVAIAVIAGLTEALTSGAAHEVLCFFQNCTR